MKLGYRRQSLSLGRPPVNGYTRICKIVDVSAGWGLHRTGGGGDGGGEGGGGDGAGGKASFDSHKPVT